MKFEYRKVGTISRFDFHMSLIEILVVLLVACGLVILFVL